MGNEREAVTATLEALTGHLMQIQALLEDKEVSLRESVETWEQCQYAARDIGQWIDNTKDSLNSPASKKRSLRDQLTARAKVAAEVDIQRTKLHIATQKLKVNFHAGVDEEVGVAQEVMQLQGRLDELYSDLQDQCRTLQATVTQMDNYHHEITGLRQQMLSAETQLRQLSNLAYSQRERDKAQPDEDVVLQQQEVLQAHIESHLHQIHELTQRIYNIDSTELVLTTTENDNHDTTETIITHTTHLQQQHISSPSTVVEISFAHDHDRETDSEVKQLTSTDEKTLVYRDDASVGGKNEATVAAIDLPLSWADVAAGRKSPNPQSFSDETIQFSFNQAYSRPQSQAASRPQSQTASRPASQVAATSSQTGSRPTSVASRPHSQSASRYATPNPSPKPRKKQPFRDPDAVDKQKDKQSLYIQKDKQEEDETDFKTVSHQKTDGRPPIRERKVRQSEKQQQFSKSQKSQSFEQDEKTRRYHDRKEQSIRQKVKDVSYQEKQSDTKTKKINDYKSPQNIPSGSEKQRDRSQETKASKTVAAKRSPLKKSHSEDSHDTTTIEQTVSQPVYSIWSGKKTYAEILKGQLEAAAQEAAAQAMRMSEKPVEEVYLQDQSVVVTTYTATVTSYVTSGITTSITAPQSIGMEDISCYTTSSMPSSVVTSQVLEEMEVIPPGNNENHQQASMEYGSWKVENQEQQQKPQILQLTEQDPFSYKEYVTEKAYLTDRSIEVQQNEQDFMDISINLENQQIKQHQESFENSPNVSKTHISHDYPMDIEVTNIETSTITASSRASSNLETMSFYESVNQYPVTTFSTEVYNNNFNDISVYNDSLLTQSSSSASMFTSSIPDYMPSELMSQVQQRTPTPSLIMSSETPVQVVTDVVQTELPSTGYMHDVSLVAQGSVLDEELSINNTIVEIKESPQPPTDHKLTIHIPSDQAKLSLVVEDAE